MRVFRTILGMLLLTAGLPTLLVGAAFWATMQHRDPGGAFTGDMQRVATSGYALVVDDFDGLLREDAPFVRIGDTRLQLTAESGGAPAFLGIAPAAEVARYLADRGGQGGSAAEQAIHELFVRPTHGGQA